MKKIISISLISLSLLYIVQNVSKENTAFIQLFDENQNLLQSIHLSQNSDKYNLLPLKPDYRIVIVGKGNVFISS